MCGMYDLMYERFLSSSARRRRWRRKTPRRRPTSIRPSRSSLRISGYAATASLLSDVNGTQTDAMCTNRIIGPVGRAPRDCCMA